MTGKELKEFASTVPDDAVVSVRERSYGAYETRFEMQAVLTFQSTNVKKEEESTNVWDSDTNDSRSDGISRTEPVG